MNKIIVRVNGGLGNQLHCYAFGRAIAHQSKSILEFDIDSAYWNDLYGREYLLNNFSHLRIKPMNTPNTKTVKILFRIFFKFAVNFCRLLPKSIKFIIEEKAPYRYQQNLHYSNFKVNTYFIGYWASPLYYTNIENELRIELKPPTPTNKEALETLKIINSSNSCSLHYRTYEEVKDFNNNSLISYYKKAIDYIKYNNPDTIFFIFSDNIEKAKNQLINIDFKANYIDIKQAKGNLQSLIDFYLMYACKNSIIGDSTFSWWAAWLSDSKINNIVAPFGLSPWGNDWVPSHWKSINYLE